MKIDWSNAMHACEARGALLMKIGTTEEHQYVVEDLGVYVD